MTNVATVAEKRPALKTYYFSELSGSVCVGTYKDQDTISVIFPGVANTGIVFICFFHVFRPYQIFAGCG